MGTVSHLRTQLWSRVFKGETWCRSHAICCSCDMCSYILRSRRMIKLRDKNRKCDIGLKLTRSRSMASLSGVQVSLCGEAVPLSAIWRNSTLQTIWRLRHTSIIKPCRCQLYWVISRVSETTRSEQAINETSVQLSLFLHFFYLL